MQSVQLEKIKNAMILSKVDLQRTIILGSQAYRKKPYHCYYAASMSVVYYLDFEFLLTFY